MRSLQGFISNVETILSAKNQTPSVSITTPFACQVYLCIVVIVVVVVVVVVLEYWK